MARLARAPADTPGPNMQGSPSRAPARAALTPQPAPETQASVHASGTVQLMRDAGVDLESMALAVEQYLSAMTHEGASPDYAVAIELHEALSLAVSESNAARARLTMPDRVERETNAQYAWRLHNLNPGVSTNEIAAAVVGPSGHLNRATTRAQLEAMIRTRDEIVAAFSALRPISAADANRMGFRDAAIHNEDEATHCLFGGALSTGNSDQLVIGLAPSPSNPSDAYSAGVNRDLLFMDLNRLAEHLVSNPTHPLNRLPLNSNNIHHFAFRLAPADTQAALTPQPETQFSSEVTRLMQQFRESGVDLESMARALEQEFPGTTREGVSPDHALAIELRQALRLAVSELYAARDRLTMPERVERETNAQYAWRLHNLNPGVSTDEIAAAAVGPSGHLNLASTKAQLEAMIGTRDGLVAAFSTLRPISAADANRMGFRDAATHDEDEATDCLFGGALSTRNPDQLVIGLAPSPSNPNEAYSAGVNKDLEFMDLNKLAEHLASNPTHPLNRAPLNPDNIHHFAFRLE